MAGDLPLAICEFTTLAASFEEDVRAYREAGVEGIGICEIKLVEDREADQLAAFQESRLKATSCVPAVPSVLPLPLLPGPATPEERVEAILAGMRRLAPFEPTGFVCLTGPAGELGEQEARRIVVEALEVVAEEGERLGVPVGIEPMNAAFRDDWTLVTTLGEAADLVDETGADGLGFILDTWHLWDSPELEDETRRYGNRIVGVHVADWREPTRGWADRVLPGDGLADLPAIARLLESAGWDGFYELEIFSDNGSFGENYPDSLWNVEATELARRGRRALGQLRAGASSLK